LGLIAGEEIHCSKQWLLLPMPAEVIEKVYIFANHNSQGLDFRVNLEDSDTDILLQEEESYYKDNE
jgi:hypothetical protein